MKEFLIRINQEIQIKKYSYFTHFNGMKCALGQINRQLNHKTVKLSQQKKSQADKTFFPSHQRIIVYVFVTPCRFAHLHYRNRNCLAILAVVVIIMGS